MAIVSPERLAEVFVEVADTLVDDFDLVEFLQMLTSRTAELIGVPAVGLLLADAHGHLQVIAASDEATWLLELFQIQICEGPCLDAYTTQTPVVNADLRTAADRWPTFAPWATAVGFQSVHALPLRLRAKVIGTLNLFGTQVGGLEPGDVKVVQALADVATIGLLQERAIHHGDVLTEQLQHALTSRVVIEQAKGALAQAHDIDVDQAFELLCRYARDHDLRLIDVARTIVTDPTSISDLTRT